MNYYLGELFNYAHRLYNYAYKKTKNFLYFLFEQVMLMRHYMRTEKLNYKILEIYCYKNSKKTKIDKLEWIDGCDRIEVIYRLKNNRYRINFTNENIVFPIYSKKEIIKYESRMRGKNMFITATTKDGTDYADEINELLGPLNNFYKDKNIFLSANWFLSNNNDRLTLMDCNAKEYVYRWNDIIKLE